LACVLAISSTTFAATFSEGDRYAYGTATPAGQSLAGLAPIYVSSDTTDTDPTQASMRFTGRGGQNIDAVGIRLVAWDTANDTVQIGIQADDGSGNPSGTYLTSYSGAPTNDREVYAMDNTVNLTAGNVYHVVITAVSTQARSRIYCGRMNTEWDGVRKPVDLRYTIPTQECQQDAMWDIMFNYEDANNGHGVAGWNTLTYTGDSTPYQRAPAFGLYSGLTAVNEGSTTVGATAYCRLRGLVERAGQNFKISDEVISAGEALRTDHVYLNFGVVGTPDFNCIVNIVEASDPTTVLASTTLTPADAGGWKSFALDQAVDLFQGTEYMFITQESSTPGANSMYYKFNTVYGAYTSAAGNPDDSEGTYGGAALSSLTQAWNGTDWVAYNTEYDWQFAFDGYVIPEPATMVLLGLGGIGMLIRRRRS
jgi:hypothetical protein